MANTFITPDVIARAALATLYENTVMAQLVYRDYENEFVNGIGDTVTVRKPATFTANEFTPGGSITIQNATETSFPIALNHFSDVSFAVTSKDLTLEIEDFDAQLIQPAMQAITEKIDRDILLFRNDITQATGLSTTAPDFLWSDPKSAIRAGALLDQANVPSTQRSLVVGALTKASWIGTDLFNQAQQRGDTAGLQEASLGARVFGFDPYMSQNIKVPTPGAGVSTTEVGVAFHKTAVALVTRPLALPKGAANAAIANYQGFGLRVVMDYDITHKQDVVSIDCLYGVKTMDANRAVLIHGPLGT